MLIVDLLLFFAGQTRAGAHANAAGSAYAFFVQSSAHAASAASVVALHKQREWSYHLITHGFSHVQDLDEASMNRLYSAVGRATANGNAGHQLILVPLWTCLTQLDWDKLDAIAKKDADPKQSIEITLEVILTRVAKLTIVNPGDPVLKEACVIAASILYLHEPLDLRSCVVCARRLSKSLASDIHKAFAHPPLSREPCFSTRMLHI
jgi:hypothetical protein